MPSSFLQCQACGCVSERHEGFQILRARRTGADAGRPQSEELTLCAACAARREGEGFELAYRFCDQCAVPVEPGRLEFRSRTETGMHLDERAAHRTTSFALCPSCVKRYDGTGRGLMLGVVVLFAAIALFGLLGWLLR
jgi:hypothetical protein